MGICIGCFRRNVSTNWEGLCNSCSINSVDIGDRYNLFLRMLKYVWGLFFFGTIFLEVENSQLIYSIIKFLKVIIPIDNPQGFIITLYFLFVVIPLILFKRWNYFVYFVYSLLIFLVYPIYRIIIFLQN